jgi:hypothetical protein
MCIPNRELDPKARRNRTIGSMALVIGLLLWNFRSIIPANKDLIDGVCGFLLGFSITINLFGLRRARRCREEAV